MLFSGERDLPQFCGSCNLPHLRNLLPPPLCNFVTPAPIFEYCVVTSSDTSLGWVQFVEETVKLAEGHKVGSGFDADTRSGPQVIASTRHVVHLPSNILYAFPYLPRAAPLGFCKEMGVCTNPTFLLWLHSCTRSVSSYVGICLDTVEFAQWYERTQPVATLCYLLRIEKILAVVSSYREMFDSGSAD